MQRQVQVDRARLQLSWKPSRGARGDELEGETMFKSTKALTVFIYFYSHLYCMLQTDTQLKAVSSIQVRWRGKWGGRLTGFETMKVSWLSATSSSQTAWCNKHTPCYTHTHTHTLSASPAAALSSIRKSCSIQSRKTLNTSVCVCVCMYVPVVMKAAMCPPSCWKDSLIG